MNPVIVDPELKNTFDFTLRNHLSARVFAIKRMFHFNEGSRVPKDK